MSVQLHVTPHLWWYTSRAAGLTAWALVVASVCWGLMLSTKVLPRRVTSRWLLDLHRFLGGLTVVFVGVHLLGLFLDGYVHFGPEQLFVPLATTWHPVPVAWGIVGLYLLVAVEVTSLLMRRLPKRLWRRVHQSTFALLALTSVHALTAGTDRRQPVLQIGVVVLSSVFVFFVTYKYLAPRRAVRQARAATAQDKAERARLRPVA